MQHTVYISGFIGEDKDKNITGYTAKELIAGLPDGMDEIVVYIDSNGGKAYEAWLIFYVLKQLQTQYNVKVITIALNACKSAATIIHLVAPLENRFVTDDTEYMIHEAFDPKGGTAKVLAMKAEAMKTVTNEIIGLYATETGLDIEFISEMLAVETTLKAEQAVALKFAAGIAETPAMFEALALSLTLNPEIQKRLETSLGYKRKEMPQIDVKFLPDFLAYIRAKYGEGAITYEKRPLNKLKPSQNELEDQKVYEKIGGNGWKSRQYIVSKDGYLIDGHHDWAAGLSRLGETLVECIIINLKARELIAETNKLKITYNASV